MFELNKNETFENIWQAVEPKVYSDHEANLINAFLKEKY